jgi:hypothetical protein
LKLKDLFIKKSAIVEHLCRGYFHDPLADLMIF